MSAVDWASKSGIQSDVGLVNDSVNDSDAWMVLMTVLSLESAMVTKMASLADAKSAVGFAIQVAWPRASTMVRKSISSWVQATDFALVVQSVQRWASLSALQSVVSFVC